MLPWGKCAYLKRLKNKASVYAQAKLNGIIAGKQIDEKNKSLLIIVLQKIMLVGKIV